MKRFLYRTENKHGYTELPRYDVQEVQTSPWGTPSPSERLDLDRLRANRSDAANARDLTREAVLLWLLAASDSDAAYIVGSIAGARPDLLASVRQSPDAYGGESSSWSPSAGGRAAKEHSRGTPTDRTFEQDAGTGGPAISSTNRRSEPPPHAAPETFADSCIRGPPIIQYSAFMYYCNEATETRITVDVIRIGDMKYHSEVRYNAKSAQEESLVKLKHLTGTVIFEPGEFMKEINIDLVPDNTYSAMSEFNIELLEDGLTNAVLGRYLWHCRVKLIDDDVFPSNRYKDQILAGDLTRLSRVVLIMDYLALNFQFPTVRVGSMKRLVCDQLHGIHFIVHMFLQVYLVDFVLNLAVPTEQLWLTTSRLESLVAIGLIILLPVVVLHYIDFAKHGWKIGSTSRAFLQKSLIACFLDYDEDSRAHLHAADLIMAVQRDAYKVVQDGYMSCFRIAQKLGELFAMLLFQLVSPMVFNRPFRPVSLLPSIIFPVFMFAFLAVRSNKTTDRLNKWTESENRLVHQVNETVVMYRMIADYARRPNFMDRNSKAIQDFSTARRIGVRVLENNYYFMKWLTLFVTVSFVFFGGNLVVHGEMTLGIFLTTLKLFEQIGHSWGEIYRDILLIQTTFPSLIRVVMLLNLPLELPGRMAVNRSRRKRSAAFRSEWLTSRQGSDKLPLDHMKLALTNVKVKFNPFHPSNDVPLEVASPIVRFSGEIEIPQGELICFFGHPGEGKATLLKVLGGVILPENDGVVDTMFIPSHLRVLHVPVEPFFFQGSLLDNLTFGVQPNNIDGELTRVLKICRRLGIGHDVLGYICSGAVLIWPEVLSLTERSLLNLARALIANPEVIVAHMPRMYYSAQRGRLLMDLLKEFVTSKGLEQNPAEISARRPRTCVFTAANLADLEVCDAIFSISSIDGCKRLEKTDIQRMQLETRA